MTMTKKLAAGFVVALALVGVGASSLAAPQPRGGTIPAPTMTVTVAPTATSPNVCPAGWHLKAGTKTAGGAYACTPTKMRRMIDCPSGTEYFDDGCAIGCVVPVK